MRFIRTGAAILCAICMLSALTGCQLTPNISFKSALDELENTKSYSCIQTDKETCQLAGEIAEICRTSSADVEHKPFKGKVKETVYGRGNPETEIETRYQEETAEGIMGYTWDALSQTWFGGASDKVNEPAFLLKLADNLKAEKYLQEAKEGNTVLDIFEVTVDSAWIEHPFDPYDDPQVLDKFQTIVGDLTGKAYIDRKTGHLVKIVMDDIAPQINAYWEATLRQGSEIEKWSSYVISIEITGIDNVAPITIPKEAKDSIVN